MPNKLINEKSPYLLQHAYNPVEWYPWGEEAFNKAKSENKPVFLSIGYSTCHWCHVMEHESFEDETVASLMNDAFVSIKVDREERPDIDGIYMNVCQMLTGSGGWPLTIIMTHDKKPFFAGTYFPKESRFGRTGMLELIPQVKRLWTTKHDEILKSAGEIINVIKQSSGNRIIEKIEDNIFENAYNEFKIRFDEQYGGFGSAPKFPSPHNLIFLMRYGKKKNEPEALRMVEKTLRYMRTGGIYDHLGFGFHRYSTDNEWLVPHFEKMLYDQALCALAYIEAYQITNDIFYKETAEEILMYVKRDMTSPEGGFFSAEDADSEGEEGKFYLWKTSELQNILSEDEINFADKIFNIKEEGNWIDQMYGNRNGTNILYTHGRTDKLLSEFGLSSDEFDKKLNTIRTKMYNYRENGVHPHKDDKILTDWNSLMITAFAKAYCVFGDEEFLSTAENCAYLILNKLKKGSRLLHRYKDGEAAIPALLDDYAFFIAALLDLYESTFKLNYLNAALELNSFLLDHFLDKDFGGFFFTSDDSKELPVRQKEIYDGAVPSGNSIQMMNLLRLSRITSNTGYEKIASNLKDTFSENIAKTPSAYTQLLMGIQLALDPSLEIVIVGNINSNDTKSLIKLVRGKYLPNKALILKEPDSSELTYIAPYTNDQTMIDGKATVYICRNFVCELPVTNTVDLEKLLEEI